MDPSTPTQASPPPCPDPARGANAASTAGQRAALAARLRRSLILTDTAFLRNPHYRRATDTGATLDYAFMAMVTEATAGALVRLAHAA